jgi:hypothetical protein
MNVYNAYTYLLAPANPPIHHLKLNPRSSILDHHHHHRCIQRLDSFLVLILPTVLVALFF